MFPILVVLCILFLLRWYRDGKVEILPPPFPGEIPLIGHAHLLIGDGKYLWRMIQKIQNHCLKNGGVTRVKLGPELFYVICDAQDYFTVMEACLEKNYFYRKILSPWVGEGLVTASVPVWKRHQKLLYPSFGHHVVDGFIDVHNSQARILVEQLASFVGKGPFEPLDYIGKSALEANFLTAFGLELDETTKHQMEVYMAAFAEIRRVMTKRIQNIWMHNDFLYSFTELKKRQDAALKITKDLSDMIIQRKRNEINDIAPSVNNGKKFKGFMDLILELSVDGVLSDEEIRWQVDTMILAGYDTSSTTTTYACVLIGSYPEVQEKVYKELQNVFGASDRDVEKGDLSKLVYLDAVIKEVGRLYSAAPIVTRYVDKDVQLQNYTMPAGSNCALLISGINRHHVWGEDRDQFRPERWFKSHTLPDHANAYTGFSTGKRACIGKPYAMNYMKITLAHILRHYRIMADHTAMEMQLEVFLKPAAGCSITLEPRISDLLSMGK